MIQRYEFPVLDTIFGQLRARWTVSAEEVHG